MREDEPLGIHVAGIVTQFQIMCKRRFQIRITGTDIQRIGIIGDRQQVFHARTTAASTIRESQLCLLLRLITEIHFRREIEYILFRNRINISLPISHFRILRSESHTGRQSPSFTVHTESNTGIVFVFLIFRIFALFRIKPLFLIL